MDTAPRLRNYELAGRNYSDSEVMGSFLELSPGRLIDTGNNLSVFNKLPIMILNVNPTICVPWNVLLCTDVLITWILVIE